MEVLYIAIVLISLKINHKIPAVFHNLKNYDFHFIMQELSKFKCYNKWIGKIY